MIAQSWRAASAVLILGGLALASPARAQFGASLGVVSDDRYRGVSFSDGRPAVNFSVSYDHPSGIYAGGKAIVGKPQGRGPEVVGYLDYVGFAARRASGVAIDVGAVNYHVDRYRIQRRTIDYTEAYVGVVGEHLNAHLYYAPDYYSSGARTLYADLGGGFRAAPSLRLFGHVGLLAPLGGQRGPRWRKSRYDLKAGAVLELHPAEVSLSWTRISTPYVAPALGGEPASRLAVGMALFF